MNQTVRIGKGQDLAARLPDAQITGCVGALRTPFVQELYGICPHDAFQIVGRVVVDDKNFVPLGGIVKLLDRLEQPANDVSPVADRYDDRDLW
jgi:hypothetical protein